MRAAMRWPAASRPAKKLVWAGDAAEGGHGTIDCGDVHLAVQPPDGAFKAPLAQSGLQFRRAVGSGNGDYSGAAGGFHRLAQIARRQQTALEPVAVIEQQNVHVAIKLAVLKAVIQNVNGGQIDIGDACRRIGLGQQAGAEALPGHVDWHSRFARNQKRLIAKTVSRPVWVNAGRALSWIRV